MNLNVNAVVNNLVYNISQFLLLSTFTQFIALSSISGGSKSTTTKFGVFFLNSVSAKKQTTNFTCTKFQKMFFFQVKQCESYENSNTRGYKQCAHNKPPIRIYAVCKFCAIFVAGVKSVNVVTCVATTRE